MAEEIKSRGMSFFQEGRYETAVAAFTEARRALRQMGDRHGEAEMLSNLGVAHQQMGQLEKAQEAFEESLNIFTSLDEGAGQAVAFGNLGTVLSQQGDFERAVGYLERAVEVFGEVGQVERAAGTWQLLARAYLRLGRWLDAIVAYDQGMSYATQLTASQWVLRSLIGILLRVMGIPR